MNKYCGETPLYLGGKKYTLAYPWRALAKLKTEYDEDALTEITSGRNIPAIAGVLAIGLETHHPDKNFTAETILDLSPPFADSLRALDDALTLAYFGPDGVNEKKPLRKILMWFLKLILPRKK